MPETYSPLTWRNDQSPAINETNLNHLEAGVEAIDDRVDKVERGVIDPVTVAYATTVTLDVTQGSLFRCIATGNLTLNDIIGGANGQTIVFQVQASGAQRTLSFTGSTETIDIATGQWWVGTFCYVASSNTWLLDDGSGGSGAGAGGNDLNILAPQAIPWATTITPNAATGALFRVAAVGDFTLAAPINGADGQAVVVEVTAVSGQRTVTYGSGIVTVGGSAAAVIQSGMRWTATARYNAGAASWLLTEGAGSAAAANVPMVHDVGNSGTTLTLNAAVVQGWVKTITLTGDCAFTLAGAVAGQATTLELILTQDYRGNRRVTWPSSVRWPDGRTPELSTFPGARDKLRLISYDGATWLGELIDRDFDKTGRTLIGWSMPAGPKTVPGVENDILGRWQARNTWTEVAGALYIPDTEVTPYVAANPGRAVDLGVALIPHDAAPGESGWDAALDTVIAGTHDGDHYAQGQALADMGPATVYARWWWEFNIANPSPITASKFVAAWQRAISNARRGFWHNAKPGQVLKVVYCPLVDDRVNQWNEFYPGDNYVDVIASDIYGMIWTDVNPTVSQLIGVIDERLKSLAAFGRSRGKPVALGEWGNCAPKTVGSGFDIRGAGDCVEYIDLVFDWAENPANNVRYLCYYNSSEAGVGIDLDGSPLSKARFTERAQAIQTTPPYPPPNAPTIGTATAGATSATVTFTPAASGAAAADYTVTSTPGGITATDTSSPITVTGLAAGTSYTFTVHATNQGGSSAESAASNSVTPFTSAIGFDQPWDRLLYSAVAPPSTFTITFWAYLAVDRDAYSVLLELRDSGDTTVGWVAAGSNGTDGPIYATSGGDLTGTTNFVTGQWRKIAVTRTGSTGKLYSATPAGSTQVITGTVGTGTPASITIGARGPNDSGEFWNGRIACVRVWNTVLTQAEIEAEWPSKNPVKSAGLFANWRLASIGDFTDSVAGRVLTTVGGFGHTLEQGPPVS